MPRFVVHIGPHKTGSSYLQHGLAQFADAMRARGVLYPADLGTKGHARLPTMLGDPSSHPKLAEQIRTYAQSDCAIVVLTAEDLGRRSVNEVTALRQMIGHHPVQVVFYCRSWADVCLSQWNEHVRTGYATRCDDMIRMNLEQPGRAGPINYGKKLGRWRDVFGTPALNLVSLDSLANAQLDTLAHFAATFLAIPDLPQLAPASIKRNRSPSPVDAEVIRALNQIQIERTGRRDSSMARQYVRRKRSLTLDVVYAQAQSCLDVVRFDERAPNLMQLHRSLFSQYGDRLVAPHQPGQFFGPKARDLPFVRADYLADPAVQTQLEEAYRTLAQQAAAVTIVAQTG